MIRVLLAEDTRILRDTLVSVLSLEDDINVVAQVAAGADIVPVALAERPDLAVLDIDLPGTDGLPWTAALAAALALAGRALLGLGADDEARARLLRAERIAGEHRLPHVRQDARTALHSVR